jgi:hypothetical protein
MPSKTSSLNSLSIISNPPIKSRFLFCLSATERAYDERVLIPPS